MTEENAKVSKIKTPSTQIFTTSYKAFWALTIRDGFLGQFRDKLRGNALNRIIFEIPRQTHQDRYNRTISKMGEPMDLSIVVPVYNEEKNLPELFERIQAALLPLDHSWDVTFVDDGSKDNSLEVLNALQSAHPDKVRVVVFRRNYGQTAAISAGIDHSEGEIVILMDADLQNDPADIPLLLAKLDEGFDVVSGWRKDRQDNALTRNLPSHIANKLISSSTGVKLHDYGCTLKAYRREILDNVKLYGEMHRFIPVYAYEAGGKITEVVVRHHPRKHGKANYGLERTFKVVLDLITVKFLMAFSKKPIYLFGGVGLGLMLISLGLFIWLAVRRIVAEISVLGSPWFQISIMMFILGFLAILLGLIAELVMRTYYESQDKKTYTVKQVIEPEQTIRMRKIA